MSDGVHRRDRTAELGWLLDVTRRAEHHGVEHPAPASFTASVIGRLDQAGPNLERRPVHRYLRELDEEALDLAAWGLVALQAHPRSRVIRPTLRNVAIHGYAAHALLAALEVEGR